MGPPDAGPAGELEPIDFGVRPPGPFTVAIASGTIGFHLVAEAAPETPFMIVRLTSPSGVDVVRNNEVVPRTATGFSVDVRATSVPQSSHPVAIDVEPGEWTMELDAEARITMRVRERLVADRVLDLFVYLPEGLVLDGAPIDIADAPTDPRVAARVDGFFELLLATFGIGRGQVAFVSVPGSFVEILDRDQLFDVGTHRADTSDRPAPGFHVLFTNLLTSGGKLVAGVSPATPGAALDYPQLRATVAVDIDHGVAGISDAGVMVHELGHFAGLFHTSEFSRLRYDTLDDTPECPEGVAGDACPDRNNVMFPARIFGVPLGMEVSAHQRRVMDGSMLWRSRLPSDPAPMATSHAAPAPLDPSERGLVGIEHFCGATD